MRKKHITTFILLAATVLTTLFSTKAYGQVSDFRAEDYQNNNTVALRSLLKNLSERFNADIEYSEVADSDSVANGLFLVKPWSLEESLDNVLLGTDYLFRYDKRRERYQVIRPIWYPNFHPEEGEAMLDYLADKYNDRTSWEKRKEILRKDIIHNIGLDRLPAHYKGKVFLGKKRRYGDYYVQNIGLEILPGLYCTGSIYHPTKFKRGKCPIIINPHGHYEKGRYTDLVQMRCAMHARMGCVSVAYDMFAWGEEEIYDRKLHHTSFSQTVQVLSALRLLDYMLALPEADKTRVGITGSSGGGSQTMFAAAIDERFTLSMPVVMMSSYFPGGCKCENGTDIHLSGSGTNNVEIATMFAPKPMLIVSDGDDWTSHTPDIEMPFVKRTYGFYGAEDNVENAHFGDQGHDYGYSKRQATFAFLEKHWNLDTRKLKTADGHYDETKCVIEDFDLLKVWGPNKENLPDNLITDPAELAKLLGWKQK